MQLAQRPKAREYQVLLNVCENINMWVQDHHSMDEKNSYFKMTMLDGTEAADRLAH